MTTDLTVRLARVLPPGCTIPEAILRLRTRWHALTERQAEVGLCLLLEGSNEEYGCWLGCSARTIRQHKSDLYAALGVRSAQVAAGMIATALWAGPAQEAEVA